MQTLPSVSPPPVRLESPQVGEGSSRLTIIGVGTQTKGMLDQLNRIARAGGGRVLLADDSLALSRVLQQGLSGAAPVSDFYTTVPNQRVTPLVPWAIGFLSVDAVLAVVVILNLRNRRRHG